MLFNKLFDYRKNLMGKTTALMGIGRDIYDFSRMIIKRRLFKTSPRSLEQRKSNDALLAREKQRVAEVEKNFLMPETHGTEAEKQKRNRFLKNEDFKYHGPLNSAPNFQNANKWQRNYDNHQGN